MPRNTEWIHEVITIAGGTVDEAGHAIVDELELWRRDPVACIRELIGNPAFDGDIAYAPEKVFRDRDKKIRIFDEMWTGDWWWEVQVRPTLFRVDYQAHES